MCIKCGNGLIFKPDGENELDPCVYQIIEKYKNVTVEIGECIYCGNVDVSWIRQDNTEKVNVDDE